MVSQKAQTHRCDCDKGSLDWGHNCCHRQTLVSKQRVKGAPNNTSNKGFCCFCQVSPRETEFSSRPAFGGGFCTRKGKKAGFWGQTKFDSCFKTKIPVSTKWIQLFERSWQPCNNKSQFLMFQVPSWPDPPCVWQNGFHWHCTGDPTSLSDQQVARQKDLTAGLLAKPALFHKITRCQWDQETTSGLS